MLGRFLIFGDSYSTHRDHIPAGYPYYYCTEGRGDNEPVTKMRPDQTWWGQMITRTGAKLVFNDSWSGSTIGYTGYSGDCSTSSSFIYRYRKMMDAGFFDARPLDTILVFGGTNDSWSNAPIGTNQYADWQEADLFNVLPAVCHFMCCLKQNHPAAKIVFIANCDIKQEIIDGMRDAAAHFGVDYVELRGIDKIAGHPTVSGMSQICDQLIQQLKA